MMDSKVLWKPPRLSPLDRNLKDLDLIVLQARLGLGIF